MEIPVCGNGIVEDGETRYNCCEDAGCLAGQSCVNHSCSQKVEECELIFGSGNEPLKILFVNINNAPYFDEMTGDIINNQVKSISPFKERLASIAAYRANLEADYNELDCSGLETSLSGSGFSCNDSEVYRRIDEVCPVDNLKGSITLAFVESEYGGSGGEIIYVSSSRENTLETQLTLSKNLAIHEIGHNFGLADLYYESFYFDGSPSMVWPPEFSQSFLNVDGFGCKKWCGSYTPVSQYNDSVSAQCLKFDKKEDCVSFGRNADRTCTYTGNYADCCVWSDVVFEYFETNCVPAFGSENIGINCYANSGCYFGAVYSNYAWRPVLDGEDSIMYHPANSSEFDDVSERALNNVFNCCLLDNSLNDECKEFREAYVDFLEKFNFKKRIGSCGE